MKKLVAVGIVAVCLWGVLSTIPVLFKVDPDASDSFNKGVKELTTLSSWNEKKLARILSSLADEVMACSNLTRQANLMKQYARAVYAVEFPSTLMTNCPVGVIAGYRHRLDLAFWIMYQDMPSERVGPRKHPPLDYGADMLLNGYERNCRLRTQVDQIASAWVRGDLGGSTPKKQVEMAIDMNQKNLENLLETFVLVPGVKTFYQPGGYEQALKRFEVVVGRPANLMR